MYHHIPLTDLRRSCSQGSTFQTLVLWVVTVSCYRWISTFRRNIMPLSSGLKYVGSGIRYKHRCNKVGRSEPGNSAEKQRRSGPNRVYRSYWREPNSTTLLTARKHNPTYFNRDGGSSVDIHLQDCKILQHRKLRCE